MFSANASSACAVGSACSFQWDSTTSINWWWAGTNLVMQVIKPDGPATITIPMGQFNMTGH